jgi:rubrerythrin
VGILLLMAVAGWTTSPNEKPDDAAVIWAMRLGGPLAAAWACRATLRSPTEVSLKDRLRGVQPVMDVNCPLCGVPLFPEEPAWRCPRCGIRRRALKAA